MRISPALVPTLVTAFLLSRGRRPATSPSRSTPGRSALRVDVVASPVHPFRYNQPIPTPNQTKPLLDAAARVLPRGEGRPSPSACPRGRRSRPRSRLKVALALHDLFGARLRDLAEAQVAASASGVDGTLAFTVPEVAEGQYLLAARFSAEDGPALAARSNVVFVTPQYPRLLEAARAALDEARRAATAADLREICLPSTEMLVEDAEMRWSDFGEAPRDWEFVKPQLETARAYAERLAGGRGPLEGAHRRLHQGLPLRGRRHAPAVRPLRPALVRPGEGVAAAGGPARLRLEPPAPPATPLRPRQRAGRGRLRGDPEGRPLPRRRLPRAHSVRPRRVGRLQRHRRGRRAAGHGPRPAGLQRRPRPGAPHRPLDGRRGHVAHRPPLPRPLRLDLAGVRGGRPRPHALDGRLGQRSTASS